MTRRAKLFLAYVAQSAPLVRLQNRRAAKDFKWAFGW